MAFGTAAKTWYGSIRVSEHTKLQLHLPPSPTCVPLNQGRTYQVGSPASWRQTVIRTHPPTPPVARHPSLQVTTYRTELVVFHVLNSVLTCPVRSLVH